MAPRFRRSEEYELLPRSSLDQEVDYDSYTSPKFGRKLYNQPPFWLRVPLRLTRRALSFRLPGDRKHVRGLLARILYWSLAVTPGIIFFLALFTALFLPSYTRLPTHYKALEQRCKASKELGRGNVNNQKVFIAATLYDAKGVLTGGKWGAAIKELIDLLGPNNTHLSVYENDPDPLAEEALKRLGNQLNCNTSLVSEHLSLDELPRILLPNGETPIKRMAFLSDVRNRALRPLQAASSPAFDKLLFVNDVYFRPIDAVQLLFSTNVDSAGYAQYDAACAVDFINAFKFYDRFATRDLEGHAMGIPFYPWFTNAGQGYSRQDVLDQKDAVRVRACWGGMTAFDAMWFLNNGAEDLPTTNSLSTKVGDLDIAPLRFRYEPNTFWDASECCLIHADLTFLNHGHTTSIESGIFTNPYVRVAYDPNTLGWLPYTQRVERLYSFIHNVLNHLVGLPGHNPRRLEQPGDEVTETVWENSQLGSAQRGSYRDVKRIARPGGFCGSKTLQVLRDSPKKGETKWYIISPPT